MEYSHLIITRNELKTSYKLATVFQLNNADFPVLSFKYVCQTVSSCVKVSSNKLISNVVVKSVCKFVCVRKFVSVPIFAQYVRSTSCHVVKRRDFDLVNKVIINTMCSVSACRKVRKSALLSVSANAFHASAPLNVTIVPPLSLLVRNVSMSVNNTCCVRKVRP